MQNLRRQCLPAASPSAADRLIPQSFASRTTGSRVRHGLQRISSTATVPTWSLIEQQAGTEVLEGYMLRPGQSPASSPHTALPTERHVETASPVVLYRDTNAWCPFCERVWMALLEKQIDFAVVFIQLYNKPEWYKELVPTTLVPAVDIRRGAQSRGIVYESLDILKALDEEFPERPLFPTDPAVAAEGERLCALSDQLSKSGYKFLLGREGGFGGGKADETLVPGFRAEFEDLLHQADEALGKHDGGPFFLGDFSYVDAMFLPSLERFAANMPFVRGLHLKGRPELPRLAAWFRALDARPSYQQVKTDDKTHHLLTQKFFSPPATHPPPPIDDVVHRARREAAAKMNANRAIIVRDCTNNSGIFSTQQRGINGNPPQPTPEVRQAVDFALRQIANCLLSGDVGPKHPEARSRSIVAAVAAYWRNRASTPRDMSASAAEEMRASCDRVLQETY